MPDSSKTIIYYDECAVPTWYLRLKHTLIICCNYCFSTATMDTRTRLSVTNIPTLPVLLDIGTTHWEVKWPICLKYFGIPVK